jgi:phosphoribosyl-AMP cyclohydrolase
VLIKVRQIGGAACHEGYKSCFFRRLDDGVFTVISNRLFDPKEVYGKG